ncbi:MAG: Gfo/Idh/MocA family oxidoreductase [Planctomycetes bacterium]|nr:Gfo/Idh/MocA family oxidoreductase [Planctomycetota bacterium]
MTTSDQPFAATRRRFLFASAGAALIGSTRVRVARTQPPRIERPGIGAIGMRYQGTVIADKARAHGDIVAIADVDRHVREQARAAFGSTPRIFEDYRDLLARPDVDLVTIGTPDHWHVKMAIDACRAGKDVYVEKPLSLTVDEGKKLGDVVRETGRVVQVGSWQRSDARFRLAAELVRQGRIGPLRRVDVVLGKNPTGGPFEHRPPPKHLNWNLWQGQTPDVAYVEERCHYTFRWWLEYSGGQLTDWGAHHIDIAQWAIGEPPVRVEGTASFPSVASGYNVPTDFEVTYAYPRGIVMTVSDHGRNGILFTGEEGRIFVNRETIAGKPIDELADHPFPRESFSLYPNDNRARPERMGKLDAIVNHMGNFLDCVASRAAPISDVESQHRAAATCHIGNIALRLGRPLAWDPVAEQFENDAEANGMLARETRSGFEVA